MERGGGWKSHCPAPSCSIASRSAVLPRSPRRIPSVFRLPRTCSAGAHGATFQLLNGDQILRGIGEARGQGGPPGLTAIRRLMRLAMEARNTSGQDGRQRINGLRRMATAVILASMAKAGPMAPERRRPDPARWASRRRGRYRGPRQALASPPSRVRPVLALIASARRCP